MASPQEAGRDVKPGEVSGATEKPDVAHRAPG